MCRLHDRVDRRIVRRHFQGGIHQKTATPRRVAQQGVKLRLKKLLEHRLQRSRLSQQGGGLRSDQRQYS
jgi:hypothetical protein